MTPQVDALIARARLAADRPDGNAPASSNERQRLERLASEFESMLMNQVLKDMRRAGHWEDDAEGVDSAGAQSLFEMLDVELASALTKAQGFGLTKQMLDAFDRAQGGVRPPTSAAVQKVLSPETRQQPLVMGEKDGHEDVSPAPAVPHPLADVDASDITSAFGWRRDPMTGETRFHRGVDLRAAYGQDVPAAAEGRVLFSGSQGSYGTTVLIEHANGTRSRYAHLSVALVRAGETVEAGQLVGRAGASGRATGPHIHFEVLDRSGAPIDPARHGEP